MLAFFNSLLPTSEMLSGGAQIVVETIKDLYPLTVSLPSRGGYSVIKQVHANFLFTKTPFKSNHPVLIFLNWVVMAIRCCRFNVKEDIVTSGDYFCDTVPAFFLKGKNKWTAYIFHIIPRKRIVSYLMQQFSILLMKRADMVVVLNPLVREYLINRGFLINRIFIQEVGVDEGAINKVKVKDKVYEACFMGRLSPSKGIFDLPKIWEGMEGELLIIGGGGFKKDVDKLKSMCGENIIFVGHKEGEGKYRLIKQSKIFIFPSYEEGLSLTLKEVLACGVPAVVWDLPVYKGIYGDKLITIPTGDIGAFRNKVKELLCVS